MMQKLLNKICLVIAISLAASSLQGQYLILDINFDGYTGTAATVPAGIFISSNTSTSFYTSTGNYGVAAPSYKFGNDSNYIVTKFMTDIDSITFWMKGNGIPLSPLNQLRFYQSTDSINYTLFASIDSLPTTATNYTMIADQLWIGYIKIEYYKAPAGGNLAFDDLKIYSPVVIGLPKNNEATSLSIYPTPSTGIINIKSTFNSSIQGVEVFDMIGNRIYSGMPDRKGQGLYTIDLSEKNRGFYFIRIKSDETIITRRITLVE